MSVFVVDTNILLYAADLDAPEHQCCRDLLETWRRLVTPWHVTWGILYEFLRVATHPNVFRHPFALTEAWSFLDAVLASPGLEVLIPTNRHRALATDLFSEMTGLRGNLLFDARTAVLMREHGVAVIYTRDVHFHRFPSLRVIDPLAAS